MGTTMRRSGVQYTSLSDQGSGAVAAYVPGSMRREYSMTYPAPFANWPKGVGAFTTGAQRYSNETGATHVATFTPQIPKNSQRKLTFNCRITYGRHEP